MTQLRIVFILWVAVCGGVWSAGECSLYLAESNIPGAGRGVYAGTNFAQNDIVELDATVVVDEVAMQDWSLLQYAYGTADRGYGVAAFGAGMIFNHFDSHNVNLQWENSFSSANSFNSRPYSLYPDLRFIANRNIVVGEEITSTYGGASWFESRGIHMSQPAMPNETIHSLEYLQEHAVCLSQVAVGPSTLPMAGRGLFARKSFRAGDIVTVSPLLALPRHAVEKASTTSVLLNYCITSGASDVALLPIGHGSLINHGGGSANVKIHWYNWRDRSVMKMRPTGMALNAEAVVREAFSSMDIAYVATRDIDEGEELLLSYGLAWESEWRRYLQALEQWLVIYNDTIPSRTPPQFREPIAAPAMFYPLTFYASSCVGTGCDVRKRYDTNFLKAAQSEMFAISLNSVRAALQRATPIMQSKSQTNIEANRAINQNWWNILCRYVFSILRFFNIVLAERNEL